MNSPEELARLTRNKFKFYDAEMLVVMWETKLEIVRRLLPPPLQLGQRPIATASLPSAASPTS